MIVAGFGFRTGATEASLVAALQATGGMPDRLATHADKYAGLRGLGSRLGLMVVPVPGATLQNIETMTQSSASRAARGSGSVAEAAALAAAGPNARLICTRVISPDRMATCALAEGDGT